MPVHEDVYSHTRLLDEGIQKLITSLIEKRQCYCEINNGKRCSVCPTELEIHNAITELKSTWSDHEYKRRSQYDPSLYKSRVPGTCKKRERGGNLIVDNAVSLRSLTKTRGSLSLSSNSR